jgi:ferredoxin
MKLKHLKKIRIVVSLLFFACCTVLFLDISHKLAPEFFDATLYLQFIPSFIKFTVVTDIAAVGFVIIILVTLLFGRVYCSTVCPLGTIQDIFSWVTRKFRKKKRYKYKKPHNILRYSILALTAIVFVLGSMLLVNLLDPFSNFGRIFSDLARPVYISANNLLALIFESFDIYFFYFVDVIAADWEILLFPIAVLGVVGWFSIKYGRLYCNSICPVGALLGLISKLSLYKIKFDEKACTSCGACERVCKSECIESNEHELDFSRCVSCFNCFKACPAGGFKYEYSFGKKKEVEKLLVQIDTYRRNLILASTTFTLSTLGIQGEGKAKVPVKKHFPVVPPGSKSVEHFTTNCTACHLCISACPTFVLQPGFLTYGIAGIMQPKMDYAKNFCNYECNVCSNICPSGAILPLTKKQKVSVQMGKARFIKDNCVVFSDGTDCGACAEHCPTKAVKMEPYGKIFQPVINEKTCVGCGACEYICPTKPNKAIYVDGNAVHLKAEAPKFEKLDYKVDYKEDFPF